MEEMRAEDQKEEDTGTTLFHQLMAQRTDEEEEDARIIFQRLIVIARLPHDLVDRTAPGAHYEKLHLQLSKEHKWDPMTGLLLVYPSCLLHVIESSRDVLLSVLKDMQQPDGIFIEASKVMFMVHEPQSRLFPKWSHKVLDKKPSANVFKGEEEKEESTASLVCAVLSVLETLGERLEASQKDPGAMLDEAPKLIVSQKILHKLLTRDELLTPQQHLQLYNSPINICINTAQVSRSSDFETI